MEKLNAGRKVAIILGVIAAIACVLGAGGLDADEYIEVNSKPTTQWVKTRR